MLRVERANLFSQCSISVYPFHDGKFEDFEPVFQDLIKVSDLDIHLSNQDN
jgi:hypothetical protein